ncbi:MAG: pilus assembly protein [Alphaproteobacteria bacterium]|nr:pilus assembly protein [Alphaproteobacteria bacterium]
MLKRLRRFQRAREGLAAVEFALVAPLLIALFFGAIELTQAVDCRSRVNDVAATAADLVAQETSVSNSDMSNVFAALNSIMYPFADSGAQIVITSLVDSGNAGSAKVAWSDEQNSTARTVNATVAIPAGLITAGSGGSVIMAEVTYTYTSPTMVFLTGGITMTATFYSKPRRSLTVTHS